MGRNERLLIICALIALAILIPFASSSPDGLEKVAETLRVEEREPLWKGLMPDYSLEEIRDPYLSTLTSGVIGFSVVLALSVVAAKKMQKTS